MSLYSFKKYLVEECAMNPKEYPEIKCPDDSKQLLKDLWETYGADYIAEARERQVDYEDYSHLWAESEGSDPA